MLGGAVAGQRSSAVVPGCVGAECVFSAEQRWQCVLPWSKTRAGRQGRNRIRCPEFDPSLATIRAACSMTSPGLSH
jgi:hypothetical protein